MYFFLLLLRFTTFLRDFELESTLFFVGFIFCMVLPFLFFINVYYSSAFFIVCPEYKRDTK